MCLRVPSWVSKQENCNLVELQPLLKDAAACLSSCLSAYLSASCCLPFLSIASSFSDWLCAPACVIVCLSVCLRVCAFLRSILSYLCCLSCLSVNLCTPLSICLCACVSPASLSVSSVCPAMLSQSPRLTVWRQLDNTPLHARNSRGKGLPAPTPAS